MPLYDTPRRPGPIGVSAGSPAGSPGIGGMGKPPPIQLIQQMLANLPQQGVGAADQGLQQLLQTGQLPPELLKQLLDMLGQQKAGGVGIGGIPSLGATPGQLPQGRLPLVR